MLLILSIMFEFFSISQSTDILFRLSWYLFNCQSFETQKFTKKIAFFQIETQNLPVLHVSFKFAPRRQLPQRDAVGRLGAVAEEQPFEGFGASAQRFWDVAERNLYEFVCITKVSRS